jgi:hypothetical protein
MDRGTLAALWRTYLTGLAKASVGGAAPSDPFTPELDKQTAALSAMALTAPGAAPVVSTADSDAPDSDEADPAG